MSSSLSSSPALKFLSSMMSAVKRMINGLYVPIMALTVYAVVYVAFSFFMFNPYLMLAMVPMGAHQNLQVALMIETTSVDTFYFMLLSDNWIFFHHYI